MCGIPKQLAQPPNVSFPLIADIAVMRHLRQEGSMKARLSVITAVAVGAFAAGWFVRGLDPELSCKASGGWYSKTIRTCIFAEPSPATVEEAQQAANRH